MANTTRNASVSLAVVAFTLTAVVLYVQMQRKTGEMEVCESTECVSEAAAILKSMDKSVDPCNDFFTYACGGWLKRNPIPDTRGIQGIFDVVSDENKKILRRVLKSNDPNDRESVKKAKLYYQACMDEETLAKKSAGPALDVINQLGGFPLFGTGINEEDFKLEKYLADALVYATPIIVFYVYLDADDATKQILNIDQPSLILPDRQYYLEEEFDELREEMRGYIRNLIGLMWKNLAKEGKVIPYNEEALDRAVAEVYALEEDLANIILPPEYTFDIAQVYKSMTLRDFQTISPDFDFITYVSTILASADIQTTDDMLVGTITEPYLKDMMAVLKNHSIETIQNYVVIYNMQGNLNRMSKEYRDTTTSFREAFTGATSPKERWKVCLESVTSSFPLAVGAAYVEAAFSDQSRKQVLEIVSHIFEAFTEDVDNLDWMDEETKELAKRKANKMTPLMGYPEFIADKTDPRLEEEYQYAEVEKGEFFKAHYSAYNNTKMVQIKKYLKPIDKQEWGISPAEVNAYFEDSRNVIVFPAGILQSPFFDLGRPYASNFGGIGAIVGHEMMHGFDKIGADFDENGNLRNWWSNSSRMNYNHGEQCFVKQYNDYFYKEAGKYINGELTVVENAADNGAIRNAYEAYQLWKESNGDKEFNLPGFEDYDLDQLFFISYAQTFCEAETKQAAISRITDSWHAPAPSRVIGPLHNFAKFGETFKCKMGKDYMYRRPNETCVLW